MDWDVLGRVAIGVGVGLFVTGVGVAAGLHAVRDLRVRFFGCSAVATVVRTDVEPVDGEAVARDWTVVEFVAPDGTLHRDVRLRSWSTVPPLPGRRVRVYFPPDAPHEADRSRLVLTAARVTAFPALAGLGLLVAAAMLAPGLLRG